METKDSGGWPVAAPLKEQIKALGLANAEIIQGLADISQEYAAASIFCLSSDFEGFPNALAEAMAHGLAVVATDCPTGPSSLIKSGENGILVPTNSPPELSAALDLLIRNKLQRRELALNAVNSVKRLAPKLICEKWEGVFGAAK